MRRAFQRSFIPQLPIRREVARVLKATLGLGGDEDDTAIFTMCVSPRHVAAVLATRDMASFLSGYLTRRLSAGMVRKIGGSAVAGGIVIVGLWTKMAPGGQSGDRCVKIRSQEQRSRPARRSRGSNPAHPADAGASRDRQPGRDLTLSSVRGYESGVLRVKKGVPTTDWIDSAAGAMVAAASIAAPDIAATVTGFISALTLTRVAFGRNR